MAESLTAEWCLARSDACDFNFCHSIHLAAFSVPVTGKRRTTTVPAFPDHGPCNAAQKSEAAIKLDHAPFPKTFGSPQVQIATRVQRAAGQHQADKRANYNSERNHETRLTG